MTSTKPQPAKVTTAKPRGEGGPGRTQPRRTRRREGDHARWPRRWPGRGCRREGDHGQVATEKVRRAKPGDAKAHGMPKARRANVPTDESPEARHQSKAITAKPSTHRSPTPREAKRSEGDHESERPRRSDIRGSGGRPPDGRTSELVCAFRRQGNPELVFGGQGRGRTADLPLFRRSLVPTELPGRNDRPELRPIAEATQTGLEPATFAVTGRRANQLRHWALLVASTAVLPYCDVANCQLADCTLLAWYCVLPTGFEPALPP
jgi:hypothetical protein